MRAAQVKVHVAETKTDISKTRSLKDFEKAGTEKYLLSKEERVTKADNLSEG